jgi:SpoVK/Ycf46/Vps4 family AAA+-type ATPase
MGKKQHLLSRVQAFVSARVPVIWLVTGEEQRAEGGIASLASNMKFKDNEGLCAIWSTTTGQDNKPGWTTPDGWKGEGVPVFGPNPQLAMSPHGALLQARDWAIDHPTQPMVLIVRDAHHFTKKPEWRRTVKDLSRQLRDTLTTLILLSVSDQIDPDIKRDIAIIKPGLPSVEVLTTAAKQALTTLGVKDVHPHDCALALRGLGVREAQDLIKLDYVEHSQVDTERLSKLKAESLASVHGVHFEGEPSELADVGGLDKYKAWLNKRLFAFKPEARARGVDEPRGCVFVGVPGGGKTLTARATASKLGFPLIVLNLSECEGGIVGETATRMAEALRTVDALAPCVVLIDEVEKALGSGGEHDGGSKRTLVRLLLIWLQERQSQVFTCITSNDISGLPPELTRKGRIDEIWFVDLPNKADRETILSIHLAKRADRSLKPKELSAIAGKLNGYTGSEIEEAVKESILTAWERYCEGRAPDDTVTSTDVINAARDIVPMSVTYADKLAAIRAWAQGRARLASEPDEPKPKPKAPERKPERAPSPGTDLFKAALDQPW